MKLLTLERRARRLYAQLENLRQAAFQLELAEKGVRKTAFAALEGQLNDAVNATSEAAAIAKILREAP